MEVLRHSEQHPTQKCASRWWRDGRERSEKASGREIGQEEKPSSLRPVEKGRSGDVTGVRNSLM